MADEPENPALIYLRKLDNKMDRVIADAGDLKVRMTNLEERFATVELSISGVNRRIDRVESRLDRIERRLDLAEHPR